MNLLNKLFIYTLTFMASFKFRFIIIQINKDKAIESFLFTNDGDMSIRWIESEKDYEYILREVGKDETRINNTGEIII